jgi:hypothetical protein
LNKKTVICQCYNEEYLLPWFLNHHKQIFDHGIIVDYRSTDRSREIIQEICPTWEIRTTKNKHFDSQPTSGYKVSPVDDEIMEIEAACKGWRIALNVTEFLVGNYARLTDTTADTQYFISNYVFVDPLNGVEPTYDLPLYKQITWGYYENKNDTRALANGQRAARSLHNYPIKYTAGRHFNKPATFDDLAIFYYAFAIQNEQMINRKTQIKDNMSEVERKKNTGRHPNMVTKEQYLNNINSHHRTKSKELKDTIAPLIAVHDELTRLKQ